MKDIANFVAGRYAVIVSGKPSVDDIKLSVYLDYPLLNGDPIKRQSLESNEIVWSLFSQC